MIIAGLDVGTQSTKLVCYDTDTHALVASASASYGLFSAPDGTREQDASTFVDAVATCFSQIGVSVKKSIKGIGVSGQQHGFVPLDAKGEVLAPVKLWCDTSTFRQCQELTDALGGPENVYALLGNQILPGYTASKVLALRENHPEVYVRLAHALLPHDYVNFYLTGRYVMEAGDASGTAFFDVRKKRWSEETLHAIDKDCDWSSVLPELVPSDTVIGTVLPPVAKVLGLEGEVMVSAGGGDNMMSAIGTGCVENGMMAVSMGTSGTMFGSSDTVVTDPQGRLAAFCSSTNGYLPLLCTMNCTVATENVCKLFSMDVHELDSLAAGSPIGADGVVLLPYFNGERTPNYPHGKGVVGGLTNLNMTKANIARAALESAVYSLRQGLDAFSSLGFTASRILLTGGGAKSPVWRQMVSDVMERPVDVPLIAESAAFGAALQAYWAMTGIPLVKLCRDHVGYDPRKKCMPEASALDAYRASYKAYASYGACLEPLFR
mgnify:CR=1 FL=1